MLFESVDYQQHQRPVGLDRRPAVEPPVPKCLVAQPRRLAQSVGDHGGAVDSRYITSRDDEREREFGVTRACAEPPTERLPCLRSEEHTSELQSLMRISYAVFCLKKKKNKNRYLSTRTSNDMINDTYDTI